MSEPTARRERKKKNVKRVVNSLGCETREKYSFRKRLSLGTHEMYGFLIPVRTET
jgi:hypothetical protein